jgi:hypothetical protein
MICPWTHQQMRYHMDSIETTSHPFIVRIWLEEPAEGARRARWRGHITHVPSGKRLYFQDLDVILRFIRECTQANTEQPSVGQKCP